MKWLSEAFWRLRHRLRRERPPDWHQAVRAAGFYPAYADEYGSGIYALDRDGAVWLAPSPTAWPAAQRVEVPEIIHVARVRAARWTPAMRAFFPKRTPDARECPGCHGAGHPPIPARFWSTVRCECDGLGWVPAGWCRERTSGGRWLNFRLGPWPH